jgi:ribosomal protein S18 acetylase RimI-like enzyme
MIFRKAETSDIPQLHSIRISVKENMLPDPSIITESDYKEFLNVRGKGWLCEVDNMIAGFAIVDFKNKNIWALFVTPEFEGRGIGRKLQEIMLDYYFQRNIEKLWLGTAPGTRAENFYRRSGWKETGTRPNGEILFEMSLNEWKEKSDGNRY